MSTSRGQNIECWALVCPNCLRLRIRRNRVSSWSCRRRNFLHLGLCIFWPRNSLSLESSLLY